ncbi:MAG: hypothetical protein JSU81_07385 [Candidatus Coatesbacteria bacterium]|nr:MAG: hypothetical protein JSU81_07385 [Candidatus Coatesbacteria bacterium]
MVYHKRFRQRFLPGILFPLLLGAACTNDNVEPGTTPYQNTEPQYVLANVERAFNAGDLVLLEACLADDFAFYFDPGDVGKTVNGYEIPGRWTREEFRLVIANLVERTFSRSLHCGWRSVGRPDPGRNTYFVAKVLLRLVVQENEHHEWALDQASCNYEFASTAGRWHLRRWEDVTRCSGCIVEKSLGEVLAEYHP